MAMKTLLTILFCLVCPLAFGAAAASGSAVVYVSPIGKINSTTVVQNNGAQFGPDTTGTKTSGIQEALNSFPQTNGVGAYLGGNSIRLLPGWFNCTTQIVLPQQFPLNGWIEGSGDGNTVVVSRCPIAQDFIVSADPTKENTLQGGIKNMMILRGRFLDTNCDSLINLSGNEFQLENVILATEQSIHSNQYGSPLVWYIGVPTNAVGTIGARLGGINRTLVRFVRCFGLANGLFIKSDHVAVEYCLFGNMSEYYINGGSVVTKGNTWVAVASPGSDLKAITNTFTAGAGIIAYDNNFEMNIIQPQFFNCRVCTVCDSISGQLAVKVIDPLIESCDVRNLTAINGAGDDQGITSFLYYTRPLAGGLASIPPDKFIDLTTGTISTTSPNGESALTEFLFQAQNAAFGSDDVPAFGVRQATGGPITNLFLVDISGRMRVGNSLSLSNFAAGRVMFHNTDNTVTQLNIGAGLTLSGNTLSTSAGVDGITNGWKATLTLGGTINMTNLSSGIQFQDDVGKLGTVGPVNTVTPAYALAPDSGVTLWGTNVCTTNGLGVIQQVPIAYFGASNGAAIRIPLSITNTYPAEPYGQGNTRAFDVSTTKGPYVFQVGTNGITTVTNLVVGGSAASLTNVIINVTNLDFPSTATVSLSTLQSSIPGGRAGWVVSVTPPANCITNGLFVAFMSNNIPHIGFLNVKATAIDLPSGSYTIKVEEYQ